MYYKGSDKNDISDYGNHELINATWYYYDETEALVGNHWHYGDNGEIVVQTA